MGDGMIIAAKMAVVRLERKMVCVAYPTRICRYGRRAMEWYMTLPLGAALDNTEVRNLDSCLRRNDRGIAYGDGRFK